MATNIVLPPLSAWAASRVTGILQSKTQNAFDTAFDATFSANVTVTLNGKPVSRDEYKAQLLAESAAAPLENNTAVRINGLTEVETGNQGQLSGLVGLFYTSISDSKLLVLGAPTEREATSSLNLTIEPTEKNPQNPQVRFRGYFDPRRVVSVNQVVAESSFHASIPQSSVPKTAADNSSSSKTELGPALLSIPQHQLAKQHRAALFGDGEFGVAPVVIPGETVGDSKA